MHNDCGQIDKFHKMSFLQILFDILNGQMSRHSEKLTEEFSSNWKLYTKIEKKQIWFDKCA